MHTAILHGNCLDVLKTLPDNSVHMVVTSPPYWGLRAYGTEGQVWPDGWIGELGHEPTPQLYVAHIVAIMREVRRVLRDDGTLWLNLGDSYAGGKGASSQAWSTEHQERDTLQKAQHQIAGKGETRALDDRAMLAAAGLKPKDLVGIPWRVAFALQDDGWWLRQDIIWAKPNPMPESVTDRCTKAHEYMFLLAKSARYYYDAEAVKEPNSESSGKWGKSVPSKTAKAQGDGRHGDSSFLSSELSNEEVIDKYYTNGRNRRSVWTITTKPFREAHFATFPPDLVEPCIKAGTSQHGVCAACGAPWDRVVERKPNPSKDANTGDDERYGGLDNMGGNHQTVAGLHRNGGGVYSESKTVCWRPTCACHIGLSADDLEIIETPTGARAGDDPSLLTGRAGMNRPRGDNEGRRPITRYEQRMYAKQIKESPHRAAMQAESDDAFAHYTRTDRSGARPVPQTLLDDWISRGWIIRVSVPSAEPSPAIPATVLDPFNGAGTTGVVAKSLGRNYVGIELNPAYVEMAQRRIAATAEPLFV